MLQEIEIRPADLKDLPAMEQAGEELFDHPVKRERAIEFFNDPRHHLILAWYKDRIIGMASGFHYVHPDKDPALFVNEVSVLEGYRNRGVARRLVRSLCKYGKQLGCREAWVATEKSNIAARKAYVAAGGREDPEPVVLIEFEFGSEG